ncbi:MAG: SDR family NAD(P)-dependent oxidoreductase [Actinomycetota bacterium]|nr:SDR family NAD(P)-dependent oxidoreductase [Actinomycetota bacterium]
MTAGPSGIDPEELARALRVFRELDALPVDHPDALAVRRATAKLFKDVKVRRRRERREEVLAHDDAVTALTATGAPGRIDDETQGRSLSSTAGAPVAGTLRRARACYICKIRFTEVDAFYHQLCPACAAINHARREARTDLTDRRALLTGGRAKIGMYIALKLLRDGAHTTITTRFPRDAARRFAAMPDSPRWLHRLRVVGIDLRDPAQVTELADAVAAEGPLDILINNAAQTVRRSPGSYAHLVAAESVPLGDGPLPEFLRLGSASAVPVLVAGSTTDPLNSGAANPGPANPGAANSGPANTVAPHALAVLALTSGSASLERVADNTAIDAGGLVPDQDAANSWSRRVHEVDALEMLEVQLSNVTAPFVLVSKLRPALAASSARRAYVVNVSAMEGQFSRGYKGPGHPHTNMAKAALNMLTRTSARDFLADGILMTSVDTGWITDERPFPTKARLADEGFHAPLDLVDGAARVYDPIVRGELGEDVHGCFLKDYSPSAW